MKKLLITLIAGLTLGTAPPTWAGPDWQAIESARKAKQAQQAARRGDAVAPQAAAGTAMCPPDAPVVQLDHGPRAQTTPCLTRLHKERLGTKVQACAGAAN